MKPPGALRRELSDSRVRTIIWTDCHTPFENCTYPYENVEETAEEQKVQPRFDCIPLN